jgi:imidazolonepropionase-like amidohydrolase
MDHDHFKNASGFVDAHVHIRDLAGLAVIAEAGVIAVRDAGTKYGTALSSAGPDGPRVISAGWALFKHGGYGARFGMPAGSRDEIKTEINRLRSAGAGIIKVMASGIVSLKEPGEITRGGFDSDELAFIVDEAGRNGLPVMAHANGEAAIRNAASAGVRSIEHGFFMSDRALMIMRDHDVFWVPTVGALGRAAGQHDVAYKVKKFIDDTIDRHLTTVRKAFEQGVSLAIGTDCVLPDRHYREAYEAELAYFRRAGIPDDDVLAFAREGGMRLLGI